MDKSLDELIEESKISAELANRLRASLAALTSVDQDTFNHMLKKIHGTSKSVSADNVYRNNTSVPPKDGAKATLLSYAKALKYVVNCAADLSPDALLAHVDSVEKGKQYFFEQAAIDKMIYLAKKRGICNRE